MFQGSEASGCIVIIYPQPDDPLLTKARDRIVISGRKNTDDEGMLMSVSTQKMLGQASGSWNVTFKPSITKTYPDFLNSVCDDDWIDIVFTRGPGQWCVMRGMIDEIREREVAGGKGATVKTISITGRDFVKAWESTPIWFNTYTAENAGGAVGNRVFSGQNFTGEVDKTVKGILFGFLESLADLNRSSWDPPANVPNTAEGSFVESVIFDTDSFSNDPPRYAVNASLMDPGGAGAWELAKSWSDPGFVELWADIFVAEGLPNNDGEIPPDKAQMGLVLRDIPFPTTEEGLSSPYFSLPLNEIQPEWVQSRDVGRSGFERFNAFFVGPQINQEFGASSLIELTQPCWDVADIQQRGVRRYDIASNYSAVESNLLSLTKAQRSKVRDWFALNPYLKNGTLALTHGQPHIRVGQRVRIVGLTPEEDETFYIEGVAHTWQQGGTKTLLMVTRGWTGTDNSYLDALNKVVARFNDAPKATAADFATPPADTSIA